MGLLCDWQIRELAGRGMLTNYDTGDKKVGVISYGEGYYGYDIRVGRNFKLFSPTSCTVIDPKAFSELAFINVEADYILIPPNSFALGESVEKFDVPKNVLGVCLGKSTYARCGLVVNVTPIEPGWKGQLTVEMSNTTPLPVKVYAYEGIAQVLFFRGEGLPTRSYGGSYQGQHGITLPRVAA